MKRRMTAFILSLIFAIVMPASAQEETTVCTPCEGLEISLPSECWVVTEDTPENALIFKFLGVKKEELIGQFGSSRICLFAQLDGFDDQMSIEVMDGVYKEFSEASDVALKAIMEAFITQWGYKGMDVSEYEIYPHEQTRFLKYRYTNADGKQGMQYLTMHGAKTYYFTFQSDLDADDEEKMDAIIDSIQFIQAESEQ